MPGRKRSLTSRPNGNNIYNSTNSRKVSKYNDTKSVKRFKESLKPGSKIVRRGSPDRFIDNDSAFSDNESLRSEESIESFDMNMAADRFNTKPKFQQNAENEYPSYFEQFKAMTFDNPNAPSAANKVGGDGTRISQLQRERDLAAGQGFSNFDKDEDMRYGVTNDMRHINMVPHFSNKGGYGNSYESEERRNNNLQRRMEMFTGSPSGLEYRPKTERKPLFNPIVGLTNIYGSPNFTDFYESRYIPSRYRNNEKPFQEVKVSPGLNLGYNELGKHGFHDTYRPLPRTTDQLRTADNPKISYGQPVIYGMKGVKRGSLPNVVTRKAPTYKENDPRDMQKSLGYIRAPKIRENFDIAPTNRAQTTTAYAGPAKYAYMSDRHRPESMLEKYKISHNQNFEHAGPRNLGRRETDKPIAVDYNDIPALTIKDLIAINKRLGVAGNKEIERERAVDFDDVPELTMRDVHGKRKYVNPAGTVEHEKARAIDYNDIPDLTMRDVHGKRKYVNPAGTVEHEKARAIDYNDVPDLTMRDVHGKRKYVNPAGTVEHEKARAVDYNDIPDLTLRDVHGKRKYVNPAGTLEHEKARAVDYNDIPDLTLRDIHGKRKYVNPVGTKEHEKARAVDYNDIPDLTLRDVHINKKYIGGLGTQQHEKAKVVDYDDIPDLTMRDIHINKKYIGGLGTQQHEKAKVIDYDDIPDLTMRDIHINKKYVGGLGSQQHEKAKMTDFSDIPDLTMRDIHINKKYIGGLGSQQHEKAKMTDFSDIPDLTMRDIHINKKYVGGLGTQQHEKGAYDVAHQNIAIDPTLKDMVIDNKYVGPLGRFEHEKQKSRADAENMIINEIKEELMKGQGRKPTTANYEKGPTYDFTTVTMKEPIQIDRDLYPNMEWKNVQVRPVQNYLTLDHYEYDDFGERNSEKFLLNQLGTNPFINNTQHTTIDFGADMNIEK